MAGPRHKPLCFQLAKVGWKPSFSWRISIDFLLSPTLASRFENTFFKEARKVIVIMVVSHLRSHVLALAGDVENPNESLEWISAAVVESGCDPTPRNLETSNNGYSYAAQTMPFFCLDVSEVRVHHRINENGNNNKNHNHNNVTISLGGDNGSCIWTMWSADCYGSGRCWIFPLRAQQ